MKPSTLVCCQASLMAFDRLDLWKVAGFFFSFSRASDIAEIDIYIV